jgi:uroporphyrinogen III methyltransferase/synthase
MRVLGPMKFACLGSATAREVEKFHLEVSVLPKTSTSTALADDLIAVGSLEHLRILVVTGSRNSEDLPRRLESEARAIVDRLKVYRTDFTNLAKEPAAEKFRVYGADAIAFTSASTVESFVQQAKYLVPAAGARRPLSCAIGPLTAAALREHKMPVDVESPEHSLDGLVQAVLGKLTVKKK